MFERVTGLEDENFIIAACNLATLLTGMLMMMEVKNQKILYLECRQRFCIYWEILYVVVSLEELT